MTSFAQRLTQTASDVEAVLQDILAPAGATAPGEPRLWEAMRYATLGGGKRLRAFLAVESGQILGADQQGALRAAAAIECVHAYSLIHDDLPAMDDDATRRGKPTTHIAFDEATAILAGDALQALAFQIVADPATHPDPGVRAELTLALATAAGGPGMVGGQMIDIAAETADQPFDLDQITKLQALKTGALFEFAASAGAILTGDDAARTALRTFARHFGLAFQIRDDILDEEGDEAETGKALRKDADAGKATFYSLLGGPGAHARATQEAAAAKVALASFGERAIWLNDAADFAVARTK